MADGFNQKSLNDAYAMALGLEKIAEAAPEVYDYNFSEEGITYGEPTFDPMNKRGSTKKRGSDSLNSSDVGVKETAKSEIFFDEYGRQGCEDEDDLDKYGSSGDDYAVRAKKSKSTVKKTALHEQNLVQSARNMSISKKQLLRAAATNLSKDDLRRLALSLLDER